MPRRRRFTELMKLRRLFLEGCCFVGHDTRYFPPFSAAPIILRSVKERQRRAFPWRRVSEPRRHNKPTGRAAMQSRLLTSLGKAGTSCCSYLFMTHIHKLPPGGRDLKRSGHYPRPESSPNIVQRIVHCFYGNRCFLCVFVVSFTDGPIELF